MTLKSQPLFQGRDWFSERWTAAQAYRALDIMHDLCLSQDGLPLLTLLKNQLDNFQKSITHLIEETIPANHYQHTAENGLIVVELQQLEKELKNQILSLKAPYTASNLKALMPLTLTIKEHIRKIDQ